MFNFVFAGVLLLLAPVLYGIIRGGLSKRRARLAKEAEAGNVGKSQTASSPPNEEAISSLLARDSMTGIYPTDLPQKPHIVQQTVATHPLAATEAKIFSRPGLKKVLRLPPLKQAIIWSEILKPPLSMRDPESLDHDSPAGR